MARDLGFALAGVTDAKPTSFASHIRRWLAGGKHGQMDYLAKNLNIRLDPRELVDQARSIISVADRYPARLPVDVIHGKGCAKSVSLSTTTQSTVAQDPNRLMGRIARYAWGNDYHRVIKKRLFKLVDTLRLTWPEHAYKVAVDTAPILEREHAQRAGLGWVGKHTLLIHPQQGSWLLLGQIVTTLPIEIGSQPTAMTDHCGTCTRCIDACPTGCISSYQLDAQRCISYLTIEHRGQIDPTMHQDMGDWIAGCDICQEVCPYNQEQRVAQFSGGIVAQERSAIHPDYAARAPGPIASLLEILDWNEEARREALRVSALKRIKLDMFKRNALIAAGNALAICPDVPLKQRIKQLAVDEHECQMVRETAQQVLDRLGVAIGQS